MFSTGFASLGVFFFLDRSLSSSLCTVFDSISFNIGEVLSINPSANVFVFGDVDAHHKDWLTYSGGTDRLVNCVIISGNLTQMVNFLTRIPDCHSHSPALLDFFLLTHLFYNGFPPIGKFSPFYCSVSIDFPSNSQRDAPFHRIAKGYSHADWDGLRDNLRDIPCKKSLNSVLLLLLVNFVSGFRLELMYISKVIGQASRISMVSAACAAVIVHRNHFFRL